MVCSNVAPIGRTCAVTFASLGKKMSEEKESKKAREAATMSENVNILMLQETIKTLEESKVRLLLTIKELKEKLEQQKSDQADIYYYLNKKCDESFEIIASLEEQLSNEQSDREIAEKMYEGKIDELKTLLQSTESRMGARIIDLEGKVEMLNQFAHAKEETDRQLADLTQTLQREREDHQQSVEILENKFLIEREKLRASYDQKYEMLKKDLEQSIDGKLAKKTQRTQIMNVVMKKELEAQSRHADRLLEINDEIVDRDKKLKIELDLARSLKDELLRKCNMYNRTNKDLEKKVGDAKEEQEKLKKELEKQLFSKSKEAEELRQSLIKERSRNNHKVGKMDELWFFLSKSYQILGLNRRHAIEEEQSADFYSNILLELFQHLSMKFPDFMTRFLSDHSSTFVPTSHSVASVGDVHSSSSMHQHHNTVHVGNSNQSVHSLMSGSNKDDVGIFSWRAEKFADPRPARLQAQTRTQGVQTDYLYAIDQSIPQPGYYNNHNNVETGSLWKPFDDQMSSGGASSVGAAYSLPTVLGGANNNNNNINSAAAIATNNPNKFVKRNSQKQNINNLNTSSLISAMTQEEESLANNHHGNSDEEDNIPHSHPAVRAYELHHSFHTVAGPSVTQQLTKKPLHRSSTHQSKTRKLKFPEKVSQSSNFDNGFVAIGGGLNPIVNNNAANNNDFNFNNHDWSDVSYSLKNNANMYNVANSKYSFLMDEQQTSQNLPMFLDLSVSGRRFNDNHSVGSHSTHHSQYPHPPPAGSLPKLT